MSRILEEWFEKSPGLAVKICGFTVEEEARETVALGADALGFNFWPRSKRFLGAVEDHPWIRDLAGKVLRVGVFVDACPSEIVGLVEGGWIDAAQLHGDETPEDCAQLQASGVAVIKAIGVENRDSLKGLRAYGTAAVLLDAHAPETRGGTGESIDWNLAREAVAVVPGLPVLLAAGLTPGNVAEAVAAVRPAGVDVASGVEAGVPGRKDLERVAHFIEAARGA
ncbi:MAG: N-(5'-phosphoribosyl)anthranilate isomerase [Verrucomicrobiales bacterium]